MNPTTVKELIESHASDPGRQVEILLKLVFALANKLDTDTGTTFTDYAQTIAAITTG